MFYLKGKRFGFPLIQRYGILGQNKSHPISSNRHLGIEIHYVLKGEIAWKIDGLDKPLLVSGGSFGIIPKGVAHHALEGNGTPAIRIGIIFDPHPEKQSAGSPFTSVELERIFARFDAHSSTPHRFSSRLAASLRELLTLAKPEIAVDPEGILQLRVLSSTLIYETYHLLGEPELLAAGHDVIPKIRKWIDTHLAESLSVNRLVKLSGYGRSRLYTLFMSDTGLSPNDYILRARIKKAKKILTGRGAIPSMTAIAARCGFNSSSSFSKGFRKIVGKSPREFVNSIRRT